MVCFNINGGGGGAKKQDNPHADADARPEDVLLGRTFYAGEEPLAQRGSIQTWNGALLPGDPGANAVGITPTGESRHIPAGCYLNKDVHFRPVSSSVLTVTPTEEGKTYTPAANTFYNSVEVSPIQTMNLQVVPGTIPVVSTPSSGYYFSKVTVLPVRVAVWLEECEGLQVLNYRSRLSFTPVKILIDCRDPDDDSVLRVSYGLGTDGYVLRRNDDRVNNISNGATWEIFNDGFRMETSSGYFTGTYTFFVSAY